MPRRKSLLPGWPLRVFAVWSPPEVGVSLLAMTDEPVAPSFTYSSPGSRACRAAEKAERQVKITRPDGTVIVRTFWVTSGPISPCGHRAGQCYCEE
jgi:hypothetical protein